MVRRKIPPPGNDGRPQYELEFFVTALTDMPFRDMREGMGLPLVSLSKSPRHEPIEWRSNDGKLLCKVSAGASGMATIWDYDVILYAASVLNREIERGNPTSPRMRVHPYDLLKALGQDVGGKEYRRLKSAIERLVGTMVTIERPGVQADHRRVRTFNWLAAGELEFDEATGQTAWVELELPSWLYELVVQRRDILAISADYFRLTGGVERWLYRLARRHAGRQPNGCRFGFETLHQRSGSIRELKKFAFDLRRIIRNDPLPDYSLQHEIDDRRREWLRILPREHMLEHIHNGTSRTAYRDIADRDNGTSRTAYRDIADRKPP
jgi:plasmid replication initiation protein